MAEDTLTRAELTEAVYEEVGLSRNESAELVETVLGEMSNALIRGESVKISSFGSFTIRTSQSVLAGTQKRGRRCQLLLVG